MTTPNSSLPAAEEERAAFENWVLSSVWGATTNAFYRRDMPGATRAGEYVNEKIELMWRAWNRRAALSPAKEQLAAKLHFALERARRNATFFRFDGDGQFGMWHEARSDDPLAVAFYTAHDVQKIVAEVCAESPAPAASAASEGQPVAERHLYVSRGA